MNREQQEHTILNNMIKIRDDLSSRVTAAIALHTGNPEESCPECTKPWPCPTFMVLTEK